MPGDALHVEPVDEPVTTVTAGEGHAASGSATIYWWQMTLLAARANTMEHELGEVRRDLERERRQHQRVIDRYEKLLREREDEIERLQGELESDAGGLRSLLSP